MNIKKLILILSLILSSALQSFSNDLPDYVDNQIWNDSWPIYASEFYNGKQYIVQLRCHHGSKNNWEMRLIELNINSDATLSDSGRYWVLDSGKNKTPDYNNYNAAMEVFEGKLYIYIYCNSQNYFFAFQTDINLTATLSSLPCPVDNSKLYSFSMTTYRNTLMILSVDQSKRNGQANLYVVFTRDNPSNPKAAWKKIRTQREFFHTSHSFGDCDFDAVNWIGAIDVEVIDDNGHKTTEKQMVEELIIGQYNYGYIYVDHFTGEPEELAGNSDYQWDHSHWRNECRINSNIIVSDNNIDNNVGYGLKMIEGQIAGIGMSKDANNINNPIQFILGLKRNYVTGQLNQRQIICFEYNPDTMTFSKNTNDVTYNFATNLPYGKFSVCAVCLPTQDKSFEEGSEVTTYQRYISIFSGAFDSHFNKHHYYAMLKSNQIKVKRFYVETSELLNSDKGIQACTLVGVIEGAPPTVIDNKNMYNTLCGPSFAISGLGIGQEETKNISSQNSTRWGHTNVGGYSAKEGDLSGFSIMAGGGYEVTNTVTDESTFTKSYTTGFDNSSAEMAKTGYYYYIVPDLDMYVGQVYSVDGSRHLDGCGDLVTYVQKDFFNSFIPFDLSDKDMDESIRIDNPLKLEDWVKRGEIIMNKYGKPGDSFLRERITAINNNSYTLKTTKTHATSTTKKSSWDLEIGCRFYHNKSGGDVTWNSSTSTSLGKDITINISRINIEDLALQERENPIMFYTLTGYFLNDKNSAYTKNYYDDLIRRGIMSKEDTPFIISWNIESLSEQVFSNPSEVTEIDNNPEFTIMNCIGGINIITFEDQYVEIFNTAGMKVYSGICPQGTMMVELPKGLYIIRGNHKTIKTVVR